MKLEIWQKKRQKQAKGEKRERDKGKKGTKSLTTKPRHKATRRSILSRIAISECSVYMSPPLPRPDTRQRPPPDDISGYMKR